MENLVNDERCFLTDAGARAFADACAAFFEADPYAKHLAALGEPTTTDMRTTSTNSPGS